MSLGNVVLLYHDAPVAIALKRQGQLMQYSQTRPSLQADISEALGDEYKFCHRLDLGTSGPVVFGSTHAARRLIHNRFKWREVCKLYLASVEANLPIGEYGFVDELLDDSEQRVRVGRGNLQSETEYRCIGMHEDRPLLLVRPHTGRRHQIRAHLAHIGLPIYADRLYNPSTAGSGYHLLHSVFIELPFKDSTISAFSKPNWLNGSIPNLEGIVEFYRNSDSLKDSHI